MGKFSLRVKLVLALACVLVALGSMAHPTESKASGFEIPEEGDSGSHLGADWSVTREGHLVIGNGGEQTMTSTYGPTDGVEYPWTKYGDSITRISFSGTVHGIGNFPALFNKMYGATSIDCTGFETSGVTGLAFAFSECTLLQDIRFGNQFDTSNVTQMAGMFVGNPSLTLFCPGKPRLQGGVRSTPSKAG